MTTTSPPPNDVGTTPASLQARVAGAVLRLRQQPNSRPDLRRGHSTNTERFAVPHLATLWAHAPWARTPVLRFAALAATHPDIGNSTKSVADDGTEVWPASLGRFLALTARADGAFDRIGRRMVWVQTGDVEKLHVAVRNAMPRRVTSGPRALSWTHVADLYLRWDHPDRSRRRAVRQRLLDEYFQTPARTTTRQDQQ